MKSTKQDYCPSQRVHLTPEQVRDRAAPCPICGRTINVVPNRSQSKATMAPHKSKE